MSEELLTPKMIELLKSFIGRDNDVNLVISPRHSHLKTQALAEGWLVPSDRPPVVPDYASGSGGVAAGAREGSGVPRRARGFVAPDVESSRRDSFQLADSSTG